MEKLGKEKWSYVSEAAHQAVFGELLKSEYDRVDFGLLAIDAEKDEPIGYLTARETDAESVYLKYGGSFPPIKGTRNSLPAYLALLNWLKVRYKRITTYVENTNVVYLKMAMHAGFRVIGIRNFKQDILLELFMES